jgi:hypothetical protein
MNTNSTNSHNESGTPPEEKKKTSPTVLLVYTKVSLGQPLPEPFTLTYPDNPLLMFKHSVYRPNKATLDEPEGWKRDLAYRRWINKIREQIA